MSEEKNKELTNRMNLREKLDKIDTELMSLLTRRMSISLEIAELKNKKTLPLLDSAREQEILGKTVFFCNNLTSDDKKPIQFAMKQVYSEILTQSRRIQARVLLPNIIYLIGYMGSGKTSVGKELSKLTGFSFIDMDTEIESAEHNSIRTIFNRNGEPYFRSKENMLLESISQQNELIVSCGGGIVLNEKNRTLLKASGGCVFLDGFPRDIFNRIKEDPNRPNAYFETINEKDRFTQFSTRYQKRKDFYLETSNCTIFIDQETPEQIAMGISLLLSNE